MRGRGNELNILFLLGLDASGLVLAYQLAVYMRVTLNELFSSQFTPEASYWLMPPLLFILPLTLMAFSVVGLYDRSSQQTNLDTMARVVRGITLAIMLILVGTFFVSRHLYSRSLIGILWISSILVLGPLRILAGSGLAHLRQRGLWLQKVAIVGNGERAARIGERLLYPGSEFKVEGTILPAVPDPSDDIGQQALGPLEDLEQIINQHHIDRIFLSDDGLSEADIAGIARVCERMEVQLDKTADLFGAVPKRIWVVNGLPLVSIVSAELSRWDHILKRLLDIALSLSLILVSAPLLVLIALAIRGESPGPLLFKQSRRGKGGRYFRMLKFRSMKVDAESGRERLTDLNEADGALFKLRDDPRITRVGRILRRYSLDELPQLMNVLFGEMSFVGPRPLPIKDIEANLGDPTFQFWIEKRESVLPGITGLWQVRGRSKLGFREMLTLDIYYIRNRSLLLDLQIVAKTLPVVLLGRGAY
jgi:exopolysaccharide biosynthesis polyprenyl glycosylphosphotransferase